MFRVIRQHGLSTPSPVSAGQQDPTYCTRNKCYTPTEFALLGLGAVIAGIMVGVVGISWFKYSVRPILMSLFCVFLSHDCPVLTSHYVICTLLLGSSLYISSSPVSPARSRPHPARLWLCTSNFLIVNFDNDRSFH